MVNIKGNRLSLRLSDNRMDKLRRIAESREVTMTQLIQDWIDSLEEVKKSN